MTLHYRTRLLAKVRPLTSSAVQKDACACLYIFQMSGYWIGKMTNRRELLRRSGSSSDFTSFSLVSEDNLFGKQIKNTHSVQKFPLYSYLNTPWGKPETQHRLRSLSSWVSTLLSALQSSSALSGKAYTFK